MRSLGFLRVARIVVRLCLGRKKFRNVFQTLTERLQFSDPTVHRVESLASHLALPRIGETIVNNFHDLFVSQTLQESMRGEMRNLLVVNTTDGSSIFGKSPHSIHSFILFL
jgi:hypothetical protein